MKHIVPHDLDEALARKTVERALLSYRSRYPHATVDLAWSDEATAQLTIGAKGVEVKGSLHIGTRALTFDFHVPLLLKPFKQKAIAVIDREVSSWIERAKAGELS